MTKSMTRDERTNKQASKQAAGTITKLIGVKVLELKHVDERMNERART